MYGDNKRPTQNTASKAVFWGLQNPYAKNRKFLTGCDAQRAVAGAD